MALQSNLERIDALKKEAESLLPVSSERLKILNDKLRLDWNYNSNAIEGNTLTLSETRMLLMHGFHTGNKLGRHYEEMKLHNDVLLTLEDLVQKKEPITEVLIRNLHHQLMGNEYFVKANDSLGKLVNVKGRPGEYKNKPNGVIRIINGKEQFVPFKTPDDVRIEMPELIQWYRDQEEKEELHPVALAAAFHFRFVTLHPFDDGNGRMSRILMNMILMRAGFVPAIIRLGEREKYIYALAQGQDGESLEPFVELVAEEVERSLQLLIKAAKGERIEEADDFDKKIALLDRELESVDTDQHIQFQFNADVFFKIYDSWFSQLMRELIPKIQKLNHFFKGTKHLLIIQNGAAHVEFADESADLILQKFRANCVENSKDINSHKCTIIFNTFYGTFIKGGLNTFGCVFGFVISFKYTSYEVIVDRFVPGEEINKHELMFERLLHQKLDEKEITLVVNQVSNSILEHIEYHTKKSKLR
ncbi:MAG: Fic family protein [Bacteroidia bacterium]